MIFWYGMLTTPFIAYLIIKPFKKMSITERWFQGVVITILLTAIFFVISLALGLRDGPGPT